MLAAYPDLSLTVEVSYGPTFLSLHMTFSTEPQFMQEVKT